MILTDKKIRELAKQNSLVTPFKEENLQSESYDVTIGDTVTVFKKEIRCLDIAEQSTIDTIYEEINIVDTGYVLSPKQYIMLALEETINLPENVSAHIRPKTRYTRLGLIVSDQHCNSTYSGNLRLGLFNATDYPIRIRTGYTIAQLIFDELKDIPSENKQYRNKQNAHYQNENGEFRGAKFDDAYVNKLIKDVLG
jgi:dCTP deaminase